MPCQVLDDLVHTSHVYEIDSLGKGHRFRVWLIARLRFLRLFHFDKGLFENFDLAIQSCDHMVKLGSILCLDLCAETRQFALDHLLIGRGIRKHGEDTR